MWKIKITNEARNDFNRLDKSIKIQVLKGMYKVSQNPMSTPNGYGKPLGNKSGNNLTGFFKIKYRDIGIIIAMSLRQNFIKSMAKASLTIYLKKSKKI